MSESQANSKHRDQTTQTGQSQKPNSASSVQPVDLREILQESVEAPTETSHPSNEEHLKLRRLLLQEASMLAESLFELTNNVRETKLEIYLKTINDVVLSRPSAENQFILKNMQRIFAETYGDYIKHLGHNPDVLEQIVHRTGKESRDLVEKTLAGFDATELAEQIRARALTAPDDAAKITARLMYDLTHQQVRELRAEYNSLPARELACLIYSLLHRGDLRGRRFPDREMLIYLLQYRSHKELSQIEFQYNETYHFVYDRERQPCLREQIKSVFDSTTANEILTLLDGFDANSIALEIYEYFTDYTKFIEGLADLDNVSLANDFSVQFRRSYPEYPSWQKELIAQPLIARCIEQLTVDQFDAVNAVLASKYDIELSKALYPHVGQFDPRRRAIELYLSCKVAEPCPQFKRDEQYLSDYEIAAVKDEFRLSKQTELQDIIKITATEKRAAEALRRSIKALQPVLMLNRDQLERVAECFYGIYGQTLQDWVQTTIERICRARQLPYVYETVTMLTAGIARQPVQIDIFELFSGKIKREDILRRQELESQVYQLLPELAVLIDRASQDAAATSELINFVENLTTEQLQTIEQLCVNSKQEQTAFLPGLRACLPTDLTNRFDQLLQGLNVDQIARDLQAKPALACKYLALRTEQIDSICSAYNRIFGRTFIKDLLAAEGLTDPRLKAHCLLFALADQASELQGCLLACLSGDNQEERALQILLENKAAIEIFECCYNFHFGNFAPAYQSRHGAILTMLRVLASQQLVSRVFFSKALNILEHIDHGVTENLYRHVVQPNISDEVLDSFQNWLRAYRPDIAVINKSYNALDAECTLRERVYALERPVLEINKTVLLLDGFDAHALAKRVVELVKSQAGLELGDKLLSLLALEQDGQLNLLIPADKNWTQEMYHQVRVEYRKLTGNTLLSDLVNKRVPLTGRGLNAIAHLLYGDISLSALKVFKAINQDGEGITERMDDIRQIVYRLEPIVIEALTEFYDDYITAIGRGQGLHQDLANTFGETAGFTSLMALFLPNASTAEVIEEKNDKRSSVN